MSRAFVFPGQGSQAVGMGKDLAAAFPVACHLFEEIDEALKQKLSRLMFEGPESDLTLTENAQPALMAVSLAIVRVLESDGKFTLADKCAFVAGHSLGEYSALAAARGLPVSVTARLLKARGQAMQQAVPVGQGAMAALLGLDVEAAEAVAKEAAGSDVCVVANDNAAGQAVVSGHKAAVERAVALAATKGGRRSMLLPVSAPFHCPLMEPAAKAMASALAEVLIAEPLAPLVSNVTASAVRDPAEIRRLLIEQVTGRVRWRESVLYMKGQGVDTLVELGSGRVLSGLVKRIDKEIAGQAVQTPAEIEALAKNL